MIRNEKGQSLVEFALVIPILLILIVGIVDVGRLLYTYSGLHFTTQETVRLGGFGKSDDEIQQFAQSNFNSGDSTKLTVEITPEQSLRRSGEYITVKLNYPLEPLLPITDFFTEAIQLKTDSTIRIE